MCASVDIRDETLSDSPGTRPDSILSLDASRVEDVLGRPALRVRLETAGGNEGHGTAPRGWRLSSHDRVDLRDGNPKVDGGEGVTRAIRRVVERVSPALGGRSCLAQRERDDDLARLDGTHRSLRLGVNVVYGASAAVARAGASVTGKPLHRYLAEVYGDPYRRYSPTPICPLLAGGDLVPGGSLPVRSVLAMPLGPPKIEDKLALLVATTEALEGQLRAHPGFGDGSLLVSPDGALIPPPLASDPFEALLVALGLARDAIRSVGVDPERDVVLGLHVSAAGFYKHPVYAVGSSLTTSKRLLALYRRAVDEYSLRWIEDGFAEEDVGGWEHQRRVFEAHPEVYLVGNDAVPASVFGLRRLLDLDLVNAVALKPDRAGTITSAFAFIQELGHRGVLPLLSSRVRDADATLLGDLALATGTPLVRFGGLRHPAWRARYEHLLAVDRAEASRRIRPHPLG